MILAEPGRRGILRRMRRIFLGFFIGLYTLVFGTLAMIGCLLVPNGNPLIWMARPWARCILATSGVRVRVAGRERLPDGVPFVYVTNHQSHFDVLALIHALPGQYRVVAKKELFSIPVFGWALWLAGFIRIDRSNREQAVASLELAAMKIRAGTSVVVFAEGTRSPDGSLQPLKKGAFVMAINAGCPIVPVSISGSRAVLSRDSLDIRRGSIDVVIGDPIPTSRHTLERKDLLMQEVRRAIESGFTDLKKLDGTVAGDRSGRAATGV